MTVNNKKSLFLKILKYTGITFTSFLALLFITPFIFADKIKEQIKITANEKLDAELNYTDANISFFEHFPSLTITLTELRLNGSAPFQNENFISSKEVSFGISVSSLLFGETVNIDEIYLSNASINVKVNKKGEANYNIYKSSKEENKTPKDSTENSLKLEKIAIINSKIIYDDQSANIHFDAFGFDYTGKGDLSNAIFDLYSKAKIEKLNIIYENEPYLMNKKVDADLITKINVNSLSFIFQQNDLKINQLLVDFKGKFDFLKDGYNIDFTVKSSNSNLYDVFTAFPPNYISWLAKTDLKGNTDLLLTLKGKYIASQNIAPDVKLDLKIKEGFVNYNKSAFPVSNLDVDITAEIPSLNPELIIVDARNLSLNVQKNYLKSKFYIKGISSPDVKIDLSTQIDLQKLTEAIGIPGIELKGELVAKAMANGVFDSTKKLFPVTSGIIDLKNGYLKTTYYPNPITDIAIHSKIENLKGTFQDLKVSIQPAQLTFENNPFILKADLANFEDLSYDINAKGIFDIGRIYKVFSQKGLDLDGYIKTDLVLKGKQSDAEKGNYGKLHNKGTLEIRNIAVTSTYLPKKIIIKEGTFKINNDKMSFDNFQAAYGESDFKMNGYLQNVFNYITTDSGVLKGAFTFKSNYINVDEFMSNSPTENNSATNNTTDTNTKEEETGVIIIPKNLNLKLRAVAQKINFKELTLNQSAGALQISNGALQMQNTRFNLIGAKFNMNANYSASTTQTAKFSYSIKASEFDIKRAYNEIAIFRKMASTAEKAQGKVSLDYQLKGRLNVNMEPVYPSLTGGGILSVKEVKIRGLKMFNAVSKKTKRDVLKNPNVSQVDIKSSIKNNIMTIERFKFKFAGFRPRIEGTTSLDGRLNIKMRLGLPPLGILGIPLTITGSQDNPKIKIGRNTEDLEETKDSIQ